jgi:hypothetical protein
VRPGDPTSLTPQAPKRPVKIIEKTKPSRRLEPGDLICAECGEGNAPVRKFCSRCGASLAQAEVVKKKWWQKLFPKKKQKVLEAGQRPGREGVKKKKKFSFAGVMRIARPVIGGVILVSTILWAVYAPFRNFVNDKVISIKDKALDIVQQDPVPIRPTTLSANTPGEQPDVPCSEAQGNVACRTIDQRTNTFWEFPVPAAGFTPTITINFDRRVNLDRLLVHNGAADQFTNFGRASELHFVFLPTNQSFDLPIKDTADSEEYEIKDGHDITSIQIQVTQVVNATTPGTNAAIAELEFFELD